MSASTAAATAAARHAGNSNVNVTTMTRAVYLARLRRAFLLRVHPDRFSTSCPQIRQGQAVLVKALMERWSQSDFTTWQSTSSSSLQASSSTLFHHHQSPIRPHITNGEYTFTIERRRDGALLQCQLRLDQSVEAILQSMTETLRQSGLTSTSSLLPKAPPPSSPPSAASFANSHPRLVGDDNGANDAAASWPFSSPSSYSSQIDHRYNVVSNQGRNLHHFLANLNRDEIIQRQARRTDAQAAALQVRRLYQFQAVDATSLGWSSASVAVLLQRLAALHHEHSHKFHVTSFYPLRLVFWPDDFVDYSSDNDDAALDVYGGGILSLNPAATPLQWLEKIQLVTAQTLQQVVQLRQKVQEMTRRIQDQLGGNIQLKKGFSCCNRDYFDFLSRLVADSTTATTTTNKNNTNGSAGGALVLEPQLIIVESQQACRGGSSGGRARMTVTKTGAIQVSASSSTGQIHDTMQQHEPHHHDHASAAAMVELLRDVIHNTNSTLGQKARERRAMAKHDQEQALEWSRRAVWQLGLQRVYRTSNRVSHADLVHCLDRLLAWPHGQQQQQPNGDGGDHHDDDGDDTTNSSMNGIRERLLRAGLTGNGLGIASTGQFCHLADDGSIVIPHDWR